MKEKVPAEQAVTSVEHPLPPRVQEALGELVGVAPKQFCRLARFDLLFKAAYQKPRVDWAAVALGCGYYDQAHLIAEFKDFTGMTPTAFFLPAPASVAD